EIELSALDAVFAVPEKVSASDVLERHQGQRAAIRILPAPLAPETIHDRAALERPLQNRPVIRPHRLQDLGKGDVRRIDLDIGGESEILDSWQGGWVGFDRGLDVLDARLSNVHFLAFEEIGPLRILERHHDRPIAAVTLDGEVIDIRAGGERLLNEGKS